MAEQQQQQQQQEQPEEQQLFGQITSWSKWLDQPIWRSLVVKKVWQWMRLEVISADCGLRLIFLLETHNCRDVSLLDQHLPIIKGEGTAQIMLISKDAIWDGYTEWLQVTGQTKASEGLMSNKVVQASPASCFIKCHVLSM